MKFIKKIAPALMSTMVFGSIVGVIVWDILDDSAHEKSKAEECEKNKKDVEEASEKKWSYDCEKQDIVLDPLYEIAMLIELPSKDTIYKITTSVDLPSENINTTELVEIDLSNFIKSWEEEIANRKLWAKNHKEDIEKKQNKEYLERKVANYALWLETGLKIN